MIKRICDILQEKRILLLGYGREGKSTYEFIRKHFPDKEIGIYDKNPVQENLTNVVIHSGDSFYGYLRDYDMVIKSPGIVLDTTDGELLKKFTSQTDLFLDSFSAQTIGITGTKGKSTTASLLFHVLHASGKNALLVGNIGIPVFDVLDQIDEDTVVIFELSSHQLEYVTHSPHVSVLLNIYEEHLDHYGSFEKYKVAKENIYRYQTRGDLLLYNQEFFQLPGSYLGDTITITNGSEPADAVIEDHRIIYQGEVVEIDEEKLMLKGSHNIYNMGVAYVLAERLGTSKEEFLAAITSFRPLPHRMEYVGEVQGVKYYNDSISTICETTIQGVNSLKEVDTVILGGMDRGIAYEPLVNFLLESDISNIILMPDTGYRIQKLMENSNRMRVDQRLLPVKNVEEAVATAKKVTGRGKTCLFSPAAASYGFFRNFEERGEVFKNYVLGN